VHRLPGDHRGREARGRCGTLKPHPLVLDTDIGGDVDDALALAYALRHPDLELRAVTTVSGDARKRAHIAARLLAIEGRDDVIVAAGIDGPMDRTWSGREGEGLEPGPEVSLDPRSAVDVLLADAASPDPAVVSTIGTQGNVAAAVQRDPTVAQRVPLLAVMGGVFAPIDLFGVTLPPSRDYNIVADTAASVVSLNAGFTTLYVPIDVTFRTTLRAWHLERLRAGDELCRVLAALCDVWRLVLHGRSEAPIPDDVVSFLHDPLTIACVVSREFVTVETFPVRVVVIDGVPRTVVDEGGGVPAEVVTDVDPAGFVEHWCDVVIG
jgi:purine nucleosidase